MKRMIILTAILFSTSFAGAYDVWRSSNTATNDGVYKSLCEKRAVLHGVCTSFGVASASMTVVASSYTYTDAGKIGPISTLVADQCKYYDAMFVNGMGYQKTNTAAVTILYECR